MDLHTHKKLSETLIRIVLNKFLKLNQEQKWSAIEDKDIIKENRFPADQ